MGWKFSLNRLRGESMLAGETALSEQLFLAPPFTEEVVQAVRLIATRLPLKADEASRLLWQRESNAASESEYESIAPIFERVPKPKRVLEIGPGFGRSVVFFDRKRLWEGGEISLYDADGAATKYKQKYYDRPPKWPDVSSFCGNLALLQRILDFNGLANFRIYDAAQVPLQALPGPYDLIYGFFSIGFHWSLEYYLDDLDPLLHPASLLLCTLNKSFRPFPRLREFSTRVLECREIKKNSAPLHLLLLSKGPLPEVGRSLAEAFPG